MNEEDLRVVKTRENIENTFMRLLEGKDFSQMTVTEIIRECRISKGTFYYHYRDKFDLAERLLQRQFEAYGAVVDESEAAIEAGEAEVGRLVAALMQMVAVFGRLSSIRTPELDSRKELTRFLQRKFVAYIDQRPELGIRDPEQVAVFLAAIVVAEVEMIDAGRAEPSPTFFRTLHDLARLIETLPHSSVQL
ncbi:TetR/AcrR family transcriptional regulator [Actinomyces sp.]|uniref:TetR/AcrR family transcriptional regulator n=1 Tax=Actinomyces sp. TaxID=29317 RepID=UPI0026DDC097|nr:TetR/AcrR family transcriptional regulator [Actinomyces sp.]MDO4899520.1 TetR/AcrR family transcriptional regulator [Actinomyces sp.]